MLARSAGLVLGVTASGLILHAVEARHLPPAFGLLAFIPWFMSMSALGPPAAILGAALMGLAYTVPGRWQAFNAAVLAQGGDEAQGILITLLFFGCFALPFTAYVLLDRWLLASPGGIRSWRPWVRASALAAALCFLPLPFPFTPLAQMVEAAWLLQPAAFGGEYLALAIVLLPSAAMAEWVAARSEWRIWTVRVAAPVALSIALLYLFGQSRLERFGDDERAGRGDVARIAPIGLDLPLFASPNLLWRDRPGSETSAVELSRNAVADAPACDLLVWPEVPLSVEAVRAGCQGAGQLAQALGRPILMQCYRASPDGPPFVSAEWFNPDSGAEVRWHAKSALVPFYERPLWGEPIFSAGTPGGVFEDARGLTFLPALCYALHSREHLAEGVRQGARAVLHMASFSPFGRQPIDAWDNALARIRAVEFGVPVVTASNRGRPGWIDATGRQRTRGDRHTPTSLCLEVWMPQQRPGFGGRWTGKLLVLALLGLTLIGLVRGFLLRRGGRRPPPPTSARTD